MDICRPTWTSFALHQHLSPYTNIFRPTWISFALHQHLSPYTNILRPTWTSFALHHLSPYTNILRPTWTSFALHQHLSPYTNIFRPTWTSFTLHQHLSPYMDIVRPKSTSFALLCDRYRINWDHYFRLSCKQTKQNRQQNQPTAKQNKYSARYTKAKKRTGSYLSADRSPPPLPPTHTVSRLSGKKSAACYARLDATYSPRVSGCPAMYT